MLHRKSSLLALCLVSLSWGCGSESKPDSSADSGADDGTETSSDTEPTDEPTDTEPTSTEPTDTEPTDTDTLDAGTSDDSDPGTAEPDAGGAPTGDGGNVTEPGPTSDAGLNPTPDAAAPDADVPEDTSGEPDAATSPEEDAAPPADASTPPQGDPWAACPSAEDFEGDPESALTLEVTSTGVYCATFNETRTLKEELAAKAQLRFTPGTYAMPDALSSEVTWPACIRMGQGEGVGATSGSTAHSISTFEENVTHALDAEQAFEALGPGTLRVRVERTADDGSDPVFLLDGTASDIEDFSVYQSFEWCGNENGECFPGVVFDSCQWENGQLNRHEVTLETGDIDFELRLGQSFAGTEPGAFVRASGTFNGQAFDQTDYYKLIYHPAHHHFERAFVVLFDEPIDGVCGVEVSSLEPFGNDVTDKAFTVDCDLNHLETLSVEAHTLVREE